MEEKNFLGLVGLKYFWTKIETKVVKIIEEQIAEIIAEAPENLNTLKEIADWISTHENSASAMNTAILANKTAINGKADKSHTHTKSQITDFPTSLPANGGTATKATQDGNGNVITSTYVKKSGDTLTSSTSDTPLYVNTTASGKTKSWIGFQIGSVSKNYIGADQNGLYSYTNSKNNKILDTSAQTLTDEEKTQVRSNIGAGTSSLTIGTTETTAAAGNHTHSGYLTAHQDISGKLNVDGSNATNTGTSAIVHSLDTATGDVTDDTEIITSNASGYSSSDTKYYKRAGNKLWNYIKSKADSIYAASSHTHTKSQITDFPTSLKNPNSLTVNGKTYDGSTAVEAGVQTVANGGTGVTTQAEINKAFISDLEAGESDVTDGTEFVSSYASDNGFSDTNAINTPYKRKFIKVWNYIKDKISSVLGLTKENYGGTAATILDYVKGTPIKVRWGGPDINSAEWYPAFNADGSALEPISRTNIHAGTADIANALSNRGDITNTDTFQNVMNNDGKWIITDLPEGWYGSLYSFHVGYSQSGLMFRIRGGSRDIRNVEVNYSVDSNRFAGSWTPLIGRIPTSAPSSPQDGDIWIE